MSRIEVTLAALKAQGRKALIPYVMAGFPYADVTPDLMHGMVAAGADIIELGVPFSDPSADGPVIQKAGEKALALGIGTTQVLAMVKAFRTTDNRTPVVLMGYANPVERYDLRHGKDAFIRDASAAGVDGVLVVDYPPEECETFAARLKAAGLDLIFLLAPTSTEERMAQVGRIATGYDADLTIVDMGRTETITNGWIQSKCGWTPFDGQKVKGWPVGTFVRGRRVMWQGALDATAGGAPVRFLEG